MKIECKLIRQGGTEVSIKGQDILFVPQADGRHVAEVDDADIARVLLGIEAYAEVEDDVGPAEVSDKKVEETITELKDQFAGLGEDDEGDEGKGDEGAPVPTAPEAPAAPVVKAAPKRVRPSRAKAKK